MTLIRRYVCKFLRGHEFVKDYAQKGSLKLTCLTCGFTTSGLRIGK
jgi:hypothetical protein